MNYANMIEEKALKKTFIIATLVSTLVGTFAASHNLYERLNQKKKDDNQDGAIKKLEEKLEQMTTKNKESDSEKDELKDSLDKSGRLIKREYDVCYDRLGRRFAVGDILTENELQKQIILLQQTVIGILEEALYSGRRIDRTSLDKLVWASNAARTNSLDALKGQYQRIVQELPMPPSPQEFFEAEVIELSSRGSSPRRQPIKALPPSRAKSPPEPKAKPLPPPSPRHQTAVVVVRPPPERRTSGRDFYCRYSIDLQMSPRPLARAFDPGQGSRCPACDVKLAVDCADVWGFKLSLQEKLPLVKETAQSPPARSPTAGKEVVAVTEQRMVRFRIPAKFVVKCHTPEGDYACVLCCGPRGNYSGVVVLCDDPEALVDHVVKEHKVADIEKEVDIIRG
ncbi:hypothetical protein N0V93_008382 [Gnomoniopsis smithogilvyi]|uniref:Uncharacterized protein n=1 Tax=Gnomoniopsis smithogilvyi TaxID=1191159 RepID=A0A9W9CTM6_9PEZI|nr:hypothetical protein N0V93_008382 [Gnomoniopsis smithogilvyi]